VLEFPGDVVSGTVTRDGAPVPGARVSFEARGGADTTTVADVRGVYEAVGLEPGPYTVTVSAEAVSFTLETVLPGSTQLDIDITGASIRGRAVRADGGAPLKGVEVTAWLEGGENRPAASAASNAEGAFALRSLREGRYRVVSSKAGFGQQVLELEAARGATTDVLLELEPADGVTVTVVDARSGEALEATVVVRDPARRIVANSHSGSADDGSVNIPLTAGSYLLSASASGYGTRTVPVTAPSQGTRLGLTPGGTLVIDSARPLNGRARLLLPDGEEYVQCWCNGLSRIDLHGRRTTVENVAAGSYTLEVTEDDRAVATRPVVIREGEKTTVGLE
jgi:hypothetical protein